MTNFIAEANVTDGTFIQREMTAEELAADEANRAELASKQAAETEAKAEASAQRQALLEKLGITEEEAKLLLS